MDKSGLRGGFLSGQKSGFLDLDSSNNRVQVQQAQLGTLKDDQSIGFTKGNSLILTGFSMSLGKGKGNGVDNSNNNNYSNNTSEEDEPDNGEKGKKESRWQRMKWTDNIVRLLIQVVACVGDDGSVVEGPRRRSGIFQKKGKWKTVSKIMISKGCYVSPQQCEDKFNDLNKRYKRLNDILGRGTSCRVVENPSLMDSMPQLSAKMKEDVKKILSSKHLFYKEMCAYHNGQRIPNCNDLDPIPHVQCSKENNGSEGEDAEENDESDDDESDDDKTNEMVMDGGQNCFRAEMVEYFQDPTKAQWEQREWVKKRMLQLQEQRVGIEAEAFELEKRRFKWQRFCSKKNRDLEISRLENERLILENKRMSLQLKRKELEIDLKSSGVSLDSTPLNIVKPNGRDQIHLGKHH